MLLDSPYNEIHTLRVDARRDDLRGGGERPAVRARRQRRRVRTRLSRTPQPDRVGLHRDHRRSPSWPTHGGRDRAARQTRANQGPATGALYRIAPDGGWDIVWESREDSPYDVAFDSDGTILLSTGNEGKIFRLAGDPLQPTLIARANAQQVTTMLTDRMGQVLFATSNPGKVFRLSTTRAERGTYTSDVRDAQTVATWGAIKWQAQAPPGTRVEISTRSGNTRTPDETWSDWTPAYADAEGSADQQPARAIPAVARGVGRYAERGAAADVGDRGVPPAKHAAARDVDHDSPCRAPCSSVHSPPIRRLPASMATRRIAAQPRRCPRRAGRPQALHRTSAAAPIRRGCSPSCGARRTRTGTS